MSEPVKVFLSYSHQDEELRKELVSHLSGLRQRGLIDPWHDRKISAGTEWADQIDKNLEQAHIILFLVSADFIDSRYCYDIEMKRALERHDGKTAHVIPVIVRDCDWSHAPFARLQAVPTEGKAVTTWGDRYARDTAWKIVAKEIGLIAQQIQGELQTRQMAAQQAQARDAYQVKVEKFFEDGILSPAEKSLLKLEQSRLNLSNADALDIEVQVEAAYRQHRENLASYRQTVAAELVHWAELSDQALKVLKELQTVFGLSDTEAADILAAEIEQREVSRPRIFEFEVVTVNAEGQEIDRKPGQAEYFTEDLGNSVTLDMVMIPGGTFQMGSNETDREQPIHTVTVAPFYVGKYPITQAQYEAIIDSNPSNFQGAEHPVECVSWHDAVEFCQRLSEKFGNLYRLPSEAEWEYACRAGTTTPFYFGEKLTSALANYNEGETTSVDMFPSNAFGLYDMHGNVWEWCADHWHKNYKGAPTDGSAWLSQNDNDSHSLRGGSHWYDPWLCRSASRYYFHPDGSGYDIGFRVVCALSRTF